MKTSKMTVKRLVRAFDKAFRNIRRDDKMIASESSPGFIFPYGEKSGNRTGYQVFVKVCRYSDELLKKKPRTGGLLCEK